jgi:nitrogen-specific signal transduction histidine kinase/CheY-like chemotaxis protein
VLQRTIKSLDHAYQRLEVTNQELARVREAALDARRRKAEFVVNVSHELRTPLNLILGFSQMMARAPDTYGTPLPPAYREDAEAIYRNAQHLSALVDDVLDLSQIEAGRMGLHKTVVPMADVVAEAVATVAGLVQRTHLDLQIDLPPDLPDGYVDRTRIRQVLINLLSNAVRFTDQGGITIRGRADDHWLTLSVSDTGIGIRAEDAPHIWDEFRQFGPPERRSTGNGMGLAICRTFVEIHGGRIWVDSAPGAGATFSVALPRTEVNDAIPHRPPWRTWAGTAGSREQGVVVLLTDDAETARLFERHLDGYRVVAAPNERRAARYARVARARGLVLVGSDRDAAEQLAQAVMHHLSGIPVFSCVLPDPPLKNLGLDGLHFVPKPVVRERLAAVLRGFGRTVRDIVIVDDDPETVRMLARLVRSVSRRYRVTGAVGGAEALAMLEHTQPDAVIVDLRMPEVDGYRVLAALRTRQPAAAVIVISGQPLHAVDLRVASLTLARGGGLSMRETMQCLQQALGALAEGVVPVDARSPSAAPPA